MSTPEPVYKEVVESAVASHLIYRSKISWHPSLKYEALYFLLGKLTEADLKDEHSKLMVRQQFEEGVRYLHEKWAQMREYLRVDERPGYPRRFYATRSMVTGEPFKRRTSFGPSRDRAPKEPKEIPYEVTRWPRLDPRDPRVDGLRDEINGLLREGDEDVPTYVKVTKDRKANRNDVLRIVVSLQKLYHQQGLRPSYGALDAGVPKHIGVWVEKAFLTEPEDGASLETTNQ